MKKLLMIIGLVLLGASVYAQTGMYGIEFGAEMGKVDNALKLQGFKAQESTENKTTYTLPGNPRITSLDVYKDSATGVVTEWLIKYDLSIQDMAGEAVLAELHKLHGDYDVSDDFDSDFIWYFENEKALYVNVDDGISMVLDYAPGNYDDDYYWYYEDDWYW